MSDDAIIGSSAPGNAASPEVESNGTDRPSSEITGLTTIANVEELEKKAPHIFKAMLQGIAVNICNRMKDGQDRIVAIRRAAERG